MSANTVRWLGHSCAAIRLDGLLVATDPVLRDRIAHLRRGPPVESGGLDGLDAILISHVHHDHLDLPSLDLLDASVPVLAPRGAGGLLRRRGLRDVHEMAAGDEFALEGVRVRVTHAEHGAPRRLGTGRTPALGYVLQGTASVYFAGDTGLFPAMAQIGPVDLALLPVAGWGARLPAGHLDPLEAAQALTLLRPRIAVPIHWGTFAPWQPPTVDDAPARAFAEAAARIAPDVEVHLLQPGEELALA